METYDALNLPLGSTFKVPVHFQNEHANRFAENIDGINLGFSLSHPRVLQVHIDEMSQTLTIEAQGSGECNVFVYLLSNPSIFDVFKVRVSSILRPLSPVNLHIGGSVSFAVMNPDDQAGADSSRQGMNWKSSDPSILQVGSTNGKGTGMGEGRVEVSLQNYINAASIVHVGKIAFGQIEQKSALTLNTDETMVQSNKFLPPEDLRVRVKLYLSKNGEELMPTTQYDDVTLIRQNVGIQCNSDQPSFIEATGEVNDLEGFFCVLKYKQNANHRSMPRFARVSVHAYGLLPGQTTPVYNDKVAQFEVQLLSSIKVEKAFKTGINLNRA